MVENVAVVVGGGMIGGSVLEDMVRGGVVVEAEVVVTRGEVTAK